MATLDHNGTMAIEKETIHLERRRLICLRFPELDSTLEDKARRVLDYPGSSPAAEWNTCPNSNYTDELPKGYHQMRQCGHYHH